MTSPHSSSHRFQIDLRGIIDLLANHLYSTPQVFVRELIQNAVDAITARRHIEPALEGSIRVELVPGTPPTIMVEDNGVGLDIAEVHEFLSTIGRSSKTEDVEAQDEFLGRFGIGLLSCFMVSDDITLITKTARSDKRAVEWRGAADGQYTVRELDSQGISKGTRVFLRCKEHQEEYFEADHLKWLLKQYAEMLPCRIILHDGTTETLINSDIIPWKAGANTDERSLRDYCEATFGFSPLDIIPLESEEGGIRGHAFVEPSESSPTRHQGHRIYLRDMYLTDMERELLPKWAFFVRAVVNAGDLRPVASRESLYHNETLDKASESLGLTLRNYLTGLLRKNPERLHTVMAVHGGAISAMARDDDAFFDLMIDLMEFETTQGTVRFGHFRREHEVLRVARTSEQYRRIAQVAEAQGLTIFNAGYTHHEELLYKASQRFEGMSVETFDASDLIDTFPEQDRTPERARLLEAANAALAPHGITAVLRTFKPESVSAIFGLGADAEFNRRIDRAKARASGYWQSILNELHPASEDESPGTRLCLNEANPVVQTLLSCSDESLVRTIVIILHSQALMNGLHPISEQETKALSESISSLVERCLRHGG